MGQELLAPVTEALLSFPARRLLIFLLLSYMRTSESEKPCRDSVSWGMEWKWDLLLQDVMAFSRGQFNLLETDEYEPG